MTDTPVIDWTQLDGLRADLGEGFDELVAVFLEEADSAVAALDPGAAPSAMAAALHFLKGAALNLGFASFSALCAQGEMRAKAGERVDLAPILADYQASRAEFLAGLAARRAD